MKQLSKRKRVLQFVDNVPAVRVAGKRRHVRRLLSDGDSNTKLRKSGKSGEYLTKGLSLSPADESGAGNVCAFASLGCRAACLDHQGLAGVFAEIRAARIAKTIVFYRARRWFVDQLRREIAASLAKAKAQGKRLAVRLNVFSDIPWEKIAPELFSEFTSVAFYDYTKNPKRAGQLLPNYWVTFSRSESNDSAAIANLQRGHNVAIVFDCGNPRSNNAKPLPKTWRGFRVIDGDDTDLRFDDPRGHKRGVVVGLRLKAHSDAERVGAINSGFAIQR